MTTVTVRRKETLTATRWFKMGDHPKVEALPATDPLHGVDGGDAPGAIYFTGDPNVYDIVQQGDYIMEDGYGNVYNITSGEFTDEFEIV